METNELVCYDMHLRHTDKDGKAWVQCHRVWDGERFVKAQLEAAARVGGHSAVHIITEEQYRKERQA